MIHKNKTFGIIVGIIILFIIVAGFSYNPNSYIGGVAPPCNNTNRKCPQGFKLEQLNSPNRGIPSTRCVSNNGTNKTSQSGTVGDLLTNLYNTYKGQFGGDANGLIENDWANYSGNRPPVPSKALAAKFNEFLGSTTNKPEIKKAVNGNGRRVSNENMEEMELFFSFGENF